MKHLLDTKVGPYQAMIPMVDVDTIGAGGGSIAYVDAGGIYRVGPRSAGAVPGPAAYGRGGTEPTATDALVNLGWLLPEAFLGGGMTLRADLAHEAFANGPAAVARHVRRGGVDGRRADPLPLDGAVDRGELRAQGLRSQGLRARRRRRRRPALGGEHRHRGGDAARDRPAPPRHCGRDGAPGHRHDLRVRGDHVSAPRSARRGRAATAVRGARGAGRRSARGGRRAEGQDGDPADRRLPLPGAGVRASRRRACGPRGRRLGRADPRRLPRHPRARVLASLRGAGHRDPEHPRARHRADARAHRARDRARARVAGRRAPPRGPGVVPRRRLTRAARDPLLRPAGAQGRQPASRDRRSSTSTTRRPSCRRVSTRTSTASGTSSSRSGHPPRRRPSRRCRP